jgi:hypothetical protein
MICYSSDLDGINWQEAAKVFAKASLGQRDPAQLESAFKNT